MNFDDSSDGKKETLESIFLFIVPIIAIIPLYILNIIQDINIAYYVIYSIYILGSFVIVRTNHNKLSEIGISRDNLQESMVLALGFVVAFIVAQTWGSDLHFATNLTLIGIVEQIIANFLF